MDPQQQHPPDLAKTVAMRLRQRLPDPQAFPEQLAAIRLEIVGGPMDGITANLAKNSVTIGRNPGADLPLSLDPTASTNHARIIRDGNSLWLEDLDSRNGTFIGEQRIQVRTTIGPGSLFVVGSTCLEIMPI